MSKETKIKIVKIVGFSIVGFIIIAAASDIINQIENLIISIG
ncbi:MAG TPA: hypothetical protein VK566_04040 [Nitrososphaeraceae archaeon]|nr:hypothetical protein [Nitrososphaeraceae archaeon]